MNLIKEITINDTTSNKDLIEKLKRRSETLKSLVEENVGKLNAEVSKLLPHYRSTLQQDIPQIKSIGDTPIVSKSKATNYKILEPPSRETIANQFHDNIAQDISITPINLKLRKFSELENIENVSTIPEFSVGDTELEINVEKQNEIKENLDYNEQNCDLMENKNSKKRVRSTHENIENNTDNVIYGRKIFKRRTE